MATEPHVFYIRALVADAADGGRIALDALASVVAPLGVVTQRTAKPYWKIASLTELGVEVVTPSFDRAAVHEVVAALGTGWDFMDDDGVRIDAVLSANHGGALALPGGTFAWVTAFPQSEQVG